MPNMYIAVSVYQTEETEREGLEINISVIAVVL